MKFFLKIINKHKILRFGISGGLGVLVHLFFLYVFVDFFGIWYLLATCLAFCISATTGYFLQKFFTFKNTSQNTKTQFTIFLFFNIVTFVFNILMMYLFVDYLHIRYIFSQILACLINAFFSYTFFNRIVFK
jgi:putative flippase GtrA